ncbi:MAG: formyltetrahydrofolate deformylase, partial [Alphaproteobacteria bacterium]
LTLSCADRAGIVAAVSGFLFERQCFVTQSADFGDPSTGRFFMRVAFKRSADGVPLADLLADFADVAARFGMDWRVHAGDHRLRTLVLVSNQGHCLNDLLYRWRHRHLPIDIVAVASNHETYRPNAAFYELPFHHLPVTPETKPVQEAALRALIADTRAELVVLARYMQIFSDDLCRALHGRAINIHHSFLPGFKGAAPYTQAYRRGVKLIGATAHFVTSDLDEGPIIEQAVEPVDHSHGPDELAAIGRDIECRVLARAVKAFGEHRVLLNDGKTVVFK